MDTLRHFGLKGGLITTGDDAGYIYSLYGFGLVRELELHEEAGFHPLEVIAHATTNGAQLLGLGDRLGKVRVGFTVGDPRILPEMGARVAFHDSKVPRESAPPGAVAQQAVLVPNESVQADGDTGVVFVIADGGVERRTVRLGTQSAAGQVVLAGLQVGTRLARGDLSSLADGSKVRVEK